MIARVLVVLALVALLAGCGGGKHAAPPPATTQPKPKPKPKPKPTHDAHQMTKLVVTVLDGDKRERVGGARVSLWGKSGRTDRHGVTTITAPRGRHEVSVSARGYAPVSTPVNFQHSRWQTVDVYQPDLQWPLYGATTARTQAPTKIRLRPPFRLVWSRGLGHLIEFPAVVDSGFAYIGNARGTVRAISMRSGDFAWTHLTPGFPRMASSPAVEGDDIVYHTMGGGVYVLDRNNGHLRWSWNAGSAIESSPIIVNDIDYFGDARGEMYALDLRTHQLKWRKYLGAKITSSAAISGGRLFIGDYDGRLWALSPESGATRWVGRVNGKIYGTPAVAGGRVFVPSVVVLAVGLLHERTAPLVGFDRLVRLLVACGRGRSRVLRRVQRRVLRRFGRERSRSLARSHRRPDLGSVRDRRRRRLRRELRGPHSRRESPHGPAPHDLPARRVRASLGERGAPALQRVLAHLRRRTAPLQAAAARALTAS